MIDFSTVTSLTIPEGVVAKIENGSIILWQIKNVETYTNMIPLSINADGTPYIGTNGEKGCKLGYRLSSSGAEKEAANVLVTTGFIPAKLNDIIYCENLGFKIGESDYMHSYFCAYDKDFALLAAGHSTNIMNNVTTSYTVDEKGHIKTIKIDTIVTSALANTAYIRMSFMYGKYYDGSDNIEDSIITVNQPIQ